MPIGHRRERGPFDQTFDFACSLIMRSHIVAPRHMKLGLMQNIGIANVRAHIKMLQPVSDSYRTILYSPHKASTIRLVAEPKLRK